jgi:flagellar basal-body rod modification protein FlgD
MSNLNVDLMNQLGLTPATSSASSTSTASKINGQLGQQDFLKLMSTQLNNQDPTNPMDNSQFLAQIAQFASVSGIQDMQNSIKTLTDSLISNQTMQAASLVGHQVVAAGSNAVLSSNGVLSGAVDLSQSTNNLVVGIYDSAGQLVKKMNLGAQAKGLLPITWDGITDNGMNAPAGLYQIKAQATINGTDQAMSTYVASGVDSVMIDPTTQQIMLNTTSGESVKMSDVKQIM